MVRMDYSNPKNDRELDSHAAEPVEVEEPVVEQVEDSVVPGMYKGSVVQVLGPVAEVL